MNFSGYWRSNKDRRFEVGLAGLLVIVALFLGDFNLSWEMRLMGVVVVTIVTGVGALLVSGRNKDNVHRDMYIEMSRVLKVVDYVLTSKGIPFKKRKMYGRIVFLLEGETLAVRVCQQTLRYRQRIVGTRLELVGITEENRLLADKLRQKLDEGLQLKGE